MSFIKFGNHVIAPAGAAPAPPDSFSRTQAAEILSLAHILQTKIKRMEQCATDEKARRQGLRTAVARLERNLGALREQDAKEGERLAKLTKRWNKTAGRADPGAAAPRAVAPVTPPRRVCPTAVAASAFNGDDQRFRDSYTFLGAARAPRSPLSSSPCAGRDRDHSIRSTASPQGLPTTPTAALRDGSRGILCDVQNTVGERGRKRKSSDLAGHERDLGGPSKRRKTCGSLA
ncbi:hypothetical protein GGX14DRAFT_644070 [Mycena pura]|uniref:Uncharacterized protein n=1 Tax=Mycena pura TaxID=153505 RepID=A0AAD6YES9_9AGAR|nr:hypothetical protein GGX14DRAFT_644070 [Mycena pura]